MAVSTTDTFSGPFTANGSTTAFPFTFKALTTAEVAVEFDVDGLRSMVSANDYSVVLTENGGTVTFDAAPDSGRYIYIVSNPLFTQEVQFADQERFGADAVNEVNDRAAVRDLILRGGVDRSLKFPVGEEPDDLPSADDRAEKLLTFDEDGQPVTDRSLAEFDASTSALLAATEDARDRAEAALELFYTLSENAKFVNPSAGSDTTNSGSTPTQPYASLTKALTETTAGQYIGLKRDHDHTGPVGINLSSGLNAPGRSLVAYGAGVDKPRLDVRQQIGNLTWTLVSGSSVRWQTIVTMRGALLNDGLNVATSAAYRLWHNDVALTWKYSGVDLAANQTAVEGDDGSWTIQQVGQTHPDPRLGPDSAANAQYLVTVHLPGAENPNSKDIRITDQTAVVGVVSGYLKDIRAIGGAGKDASGGQAQPSATGAFPLLDGYENEQFAAHGWVGPANLQGVNRFEGRAPEGSNALNRSLGGCFNVFTAVDYSTRTLVWEGTLYVSNGQQGVYAHGSGNRGYAAIDGENLHIIGSNVGNFFKIDGGPSSSISFIAGTVRIGRVTVTGFDALYNQASDPLWMMGTEGDDMVSEVTSAVSLAQSTASLATFSTSNVGAVMHIINHRFKIDGRVEAPDFRLNCLAVSSVPIGQPAPTLILDNCHDVQTIVGGGSPRAKAILPHVTSGGAEWWWVIIDLRNGTTVGSLSSDASPTWTPAGFYADAGTTFGWGDLTGPQIVTLFTGAGIPFDISHQTTIVNRAGAVVSAPGW